MSYETIKFDISEEVKSLGANGAYFAMRGLQIRETDPVFEQQKKDTLEALLPTLSLDSIAADPILLGFRTLHERVKVSNRKHVASPENLLQFLVQRRQMPHINLLVDIYNLVSIRTRLALGAHDIKNISGNVHLKLTNGTETFWPLGSDKPKPVGAGEYGYIDDANDIICRLEVRQVEKTKVTLATQECFYIVQGNPGSDVKHIKEATDELIEMTKRYCGGEVRFLYAPWS
jgi:DNA/RNA-binding domain of Phe-tRNA-synthetase-like protein